MGGTPSFRPKGLQNGLQSVGLQKPKERSLTQLFAA
jgi:hypothetical protein